MSQKLIRNAIGGSLALAGAVVLNLLNPDPVVLLGWFIYCAAVGLGANLAHGLSDAASIEKGSQKLR